MSNTKDIRTIKEEVAREIIAARNDRPNFRQDELWWSWKQYCHPSAQEYEDALDKVADRYTRHLRSRISELEAENKRLREKAEKWDALADKMEKFYAEDSDADLVVIGEEAAAAFGYL